MYITITLEDGENRYTVSADNGQRIRALLDTMHKNMAVSFHPKETNYLRTSRQPRVVSSDLTFEEAKIFSGDVLNLL